MEDNGFFLRIPSEFSFIHTLHKGGGTELRNTQTHSPQMHGAAIKLSVKHRARFYKVCYPHSQPRNPGLLV